MHFVEERDHIIIFPVTNEVIDRNIGFLGTNGKLLKALLAEKKRKEIIVYVTLQIIYRIRRHVPAAGNY